MKFLPLRARTAMIPLIMVGCRSGYELLEPTDADPTVGDSMGGAAGSGGRGVANTGGHQASGGHPNAGGQPASGGATNPGGTAGMGGANGMGGDPCRQCVPTDCSDVVADSVTEFSNVQGQRGWFYGYFAAPNFGVDDFVEMNEYGPIENLAEDGWTISVDYWTAVSASGMHPNGENTTAPKIGAEHWAVRRWISTEDGTLLIRGTVFAFAGSFNGVRAAILVEGQSRFEYLAPANQGEETPFETLITTSLGDRVDFILDAIDSADHSDSAVFEATICR